MPLWIIRYQRIGGRSGIFPIECVKMSSWDIRDARRTIKRRYQMHHDVVYKIIELPGTVVLYSRGDENESTENESCLTPDLIHRLISDWGQEISNRHPGYVEILKPDDS